MLCCGKQYTRTHDDVQICVLETKVCFYVPVLLAVIIRSTRHYSITLYSPGVLHKTFTVSTSGYKTKQRAIVISRY